MSFLDTILYNVFIRDDGLAALVASTAQLFADLDGPSRFP